MSHGIMASFSWAGFDETDDPDASTKASSII